MAAPIHANNGVARMLFQRMLQGGGQEDPNGAQGVQAGNHSVQLTPSSIASSNLLSAIPHMIGRALGGAQTTGGYDPTTGAYTPETAVHPLIDALLNGGQANASTQLANMRQGTALSNNMLDQSNANLAQRNGVDTASGVISTDPRTGQPSTGGVGMAGIVSNQRTLGVLNNAKIANQVLTNPDYLSTLQQGTDAANLAPVADNFATAQVSAPAGGATVAVPPGQSPVSVTGSVPTSTQSSITSGAGINPNGTYQPARTVMNAVSGGSQPTINNGAQPQTAIPLTDDEQNQIMGTAQVPNSPLALPAPAAKPSPVSVAPTTQLPSGGMFTLQQMLRNLYQQQITDPYNSTADTLNKLVGGVPSN